MGQRDNGLEESHLGAPKWEQVSVFGQRMFRLAVMARVWLQGFPCFLPPKVSKMASLKEHLHKWQSGTPDSWRVDSGELSNSWQHQLWKVQPCCLRRRGYLWHGLTEDAFKHTLPCRHFVRTGSSIAMDVTDEDVEAGVSPKENDSHDCSHGCLIGLPAASFGCKPFSYPRPTGQGTHSIFRAGCSQKPVCIWESQKPGPSLISSCSLYS